MNDKAKQSEDIEALWQQIDADFDRDDEVEVEDYLAHHGHRCKAPISLNEHVQNLINKTFSTGELNDETLISKYQIIQQIDSGGQSDVYLAERSDGVYQQTVVIKFISGRFEHQALKQQFLQEMQLLADLRHPGVVTIIDGNVTAKGQPWLVLDHIDGPHIDQYCSHKQLNAEDVIKLMLSLCNTLQFIHQQGVLHKDLKPSNVLVKQMNGVPCPVLIDFGISMTSEDEATLNFGTRGFSSPEQIKGEKIDQRSDLFSLGMLLGGLLLQVHDQQTQGAQPSRPVGDITDPATLNEALKQSGINKDLRQVVAKLTSPKASQRYQDAEALRADLNQWQLGFPLSFDNHKLMTATNKAIKRHPWITLGLFVVLFSAVFVAIKYTRDIQNQQALTVAEKNATDELMNYMLDDLYENLERIGRIDVLRNVAEKSVAHLAKKDPLTMDKDSHLQTAKAYINTGRVFDYLEQSEQAQQMFKAADQHLQHARLAGAEPLDYYPLFADLKVRQSQVLSSKGQEQATEAVLTDGIDAMNQLLLLSPESSPLMLWEAHLELAYLMMEYARASEAKEHVETTMALASEQLAQKPQDAEWLYASSQSHQMKAWYELDFGSVEQGIIETQKAITLAQASIKQDPEDLKKQNNERILHNQLAYLYLEAGDPTSAKAAALTAIELGNALKLKAPFNQEFEREQAYSFSTAGEVHQQLGDLDSALHFYQQGLAISKRNHEKDPNNFSAANDLGVDALLVAGLQLELGDELEATKAFNEIETLMEPVHQAEPNNKYYTHTLLVAKLQLKKFKDAKPLYDQLKSNDTIDKVITNLLTKNQLNW